MIFSSWLSYRIHCFWVCEKVCRPDDHREGESSAIPDERTEETDPSTAQHYASSINQCNGARRKHSWGRDVGDKNFKNLEKATKSKEVATSLPEKGSLSFVVHYSREELRQMREAREHSCLGISESQVTACSNWKKHRSAQK